MPPRLLSPRQAWLLSTPGWGDSSSDSNFMSDILFAPKNWNATWKAAKAAKASTPTWITVIGDSVATGSYAGGWTKGWVSKLMTQLCGADLSGLYAEYIPAICRQFVGTLGSSTDAPWSDISTTGLTVSTMDLVGWHRGEQVTDTAVSIQTFTVPYDCTSAYLHAAHQYGTWGWRINGGTVQTVTFDNNTWGIRKIALGALSAGDTVEYGWQSATQTVMMLGVALYKSTAAGIGIARITAGGEKMVNLADTTSNKQYPDRAPNLLAGKNPQTSAYSSTYNYGFPTQGHLHIIELGLNDMLGNTQVSVYHGALDNLIGALRHGRPDCSIMLVMPDVAVDRWSDASPFIADGTSYPPNAPAAPVVAQQGTTGITIYKVKIGFRTLYGDSVPGDVTTITNGNATLSPTDNLSIALPNLPPGALQWLIYVSNDTGVTWGAYGPSAADAPGNVYHGTLFPGTITVPATNTTGIYNASLWTVYVEAAYQLAARHGCALVNLSPAWGKDPAAKGLQGFDVHPLEDGHARIALEVGKAL